MYVFICPAFECGEFKVEVQHWEFVPGLPPDSGTGGVCGSGSAAPTSSGFEGASGECCESDEASTPQRAFTWPQRSEISHVVPDG